MAPIKDCQDYILDAVDVLTFTLVRTRDDIDNTDLAFHPLMAHQIFGETESIFGYQNLKIRLLYTAGSLHTYLGVEYGKKVDDSIDGIPPDDVVSTIARTLPDGCCFLGMDDFLKTLSKASTFRPYGEKITEYIYRDEKNDLRHFEFYHCTYQQTSFLKYFARLQTFVLWFIDAASYIDVDDPQWTYFLCYEKYKNGNGDEIYASVAYTTVYEYYAYPEHIRPRISQMLVLPPFQKIGIGTNFLEAIYQYYRTHKKVVDMTVEDPSDDFQRMRNFVDARACMTLPPFEPLELKKRFSKELTIKARELLKINPHQCRRVYEILRLMHTNIHDKDDYQSYRLEVKRRLNSTHYKQCTDIERMEKAKCDTQWLRMRLPSKEERLQQLQEEYQLVEKDYIRVVEKLRGN